MTQRIRGEILFLLELWKANLSSAMEYRASFISQVLGMMISNTFFFFFWFLFFSRFNEVKGWSIKDMIMLYAIITTGYGIGFGLFGNAMRMAELIAQGRLDYYLALPRSVLLHVLASRSVISAWGDLIFGIIAYCFVGNPGGIALWLTASLCSGAIMVCASAIFGTLSFWLGNASTLAAQANNALITLSLYPRDIFQGGVRFLMLTLLPAAFVGAIPLDIVRQGDWTRIPGLIAVALFFIILLWLLFNAGLRRYESGSALNVNI